ncbi:MAG: AAA family ATPase [Chloroflexi bacterium]|nr:AAA family ATPase [Chloroflexota bacterium]
MITSFTSMKGGTGKTTITGLFANYCSQVLNKRVVIIDIDPQGGCTSLFLGHEAREIIDGKAGLTIYNVLEAVRENNNAKSLIAKSLVKSAYNENIFIMPADYRVTSLMSMGETPDLLRYALDDAAFAEDIVVLIDSGTSPFLVNMSISAVSEMVFVPLMLSVQNRKPTADTIQLILRQKKHLGGIIPVGIGSSKWEENSMESWNERLKSTALLADARILDGIPYSKTLIHGEWVGQSFPERFIPVFENISQAVFNGKPTSPSKIEKNEPEV